jgi:hypothetical protein
MNKGNCAESKEKYYQTLGEFQGSDSSKRCNPAMMLCSLGMFKEHRGYFGHRKGRQPSAKMRAEIRAAIITARPERTLCSG